MRMLWCACAHMHMRVCRSKTVNDADLNSRVVRRLCANTANRLCTLCSSFEMLTVQIKAS